MLVALTDPEVLQGPIDATVRNGILVACVDTDSPASRRLFFIGTSNYEAGLQGGDLMAKALDGKGDIVLLTIPHQWNLEERVRGYQDAFNNYPNTKVVGILNVGGDAGRASAAVTEALRKHPDLRGIACLDAAGGPGAGEVVKKTGRTTKIAIVAMDKDRPTLELIREGVSWATIGQKNYTMSYYG